jgi:maleylpyruvate isomerase
MRELSDSMRWMHEGTALFAEALAAIDDDGFTTPSRLPGWTVAHLVAHFALNAEALGNLVAWARTGVETPMYASREQRDADIEAGATRPASDLRRWSAEAAAQLSDVLSELTSEQWQTTVRSRTGRQFPATEIPWLRSREVMVHTVDLGGKVGFAELPADFLGALMDDIVAYRSKVPEHPAVELMARNTGEGWIIPGSGTAVRVMAPLADLVAWLTGRPAAAPRVIGPGTPPELPPWI